jgi:hypothetical protein
MLTQSRSYAAPVFYILFIFLIIAYLVRTVAGILQALCQCMIYIPALLVIVKICQTKKETVHLLSSWVQDLFSNPIVGQSVATITRLADILLQTLNVTDKVGNTEGKRSS